jgi:putative ABC transport system permease protein
MDGVSAIAPVSAGQQLDAATGWKDLTVTVYVIDVAQVRAVQTDPEAAFALPDALLRQHGDAVPVLASDDLIAVIGTDPLTLGRTSVAVVGGAPARSPLGSTRLWVAVDRSFADRLGVADALPAVALIDLAPGADAARVAAAAREIAGPTGGASTPASLAAERLDDPALIGLRFALIAAIALVAALLGLAIGMTLVLGAPARGRLLALLGAVGYRRSRELALVLWEVAPAVVVALPAGAVVGLALPAIVLPAIDLTGFVGGAAQPAVRLGGLLPGAVVAGFLVVSAVAVLIAVLVARRVTAAGTLRSIDEEG